MAVTGTYATRPERAGRVALWIGSSLVLAFLSAPVLAIVPLSFNSGSFLSYPLSGLSFHWYEELFASAEWAAAFRNSLVVAFATTALATPLGTLAAIGLARLSAGEKPRAPRSCGSP